MRVFFFIIICSTTFAILPPLAQSVREIEALVTDAHMQESLGSGEAIQDIIHQEGGYLVVTQNYIMRVDVKYGRSEQRWAGPARFEFEFHPPVHSKTGVAKKTDVEESVFLK